MRKQRDDSNLIRDMVGQRLDWNLQHSEVVAWRIYHERLQVILIDRCPRGGADTREYMKVVVESATKEKIDVFVYHEKL